MGIYKTVALNKEEYIGIVNNVKNGFRYIREGEEVQFKPNPRLHAILVVQANLGLRIGDILQLRLNSFIHDGNRIRLDIVEDKTDKKREFTVPRELYNFIKMYALENKISNTQKLFDISTRAVQKQLAIVTDFMGLERVSSHSFRKFFATQIYENNNYNIALVQELLQHSDISTTRKYIGIGSKQVEEALQQHCHIVY